MMTRTAYPTSLNMRSDWIRYANSAGKLPEWKHVGDQMVTEFIHPAGISEIIYGAQSSVDMADHSWIGY